MHCRKLWKNIQQQQQQLSPLYIFPYFAKLPGCPVAMDLWDSLYGVQAVLDCCRHLYEDIEEQHEKPRL
jgi:hypothetical protein